jgi:heme exporter protein B
MRWLRQVWALVWRDLVVEWRTRESLSTMLLFALITLVIFDFAFELRVENARQIAPGALWVAFTFAGVLGLSRSLARDQEQGALEGLMLSPVGRGAIYVGKALANFLTMTLTEAILLPLFAALFDVPLIQGGVILIILLGTVGFVAVGTLLAAMAVNTRAREALLPILLFPMAVPVLLAAVKATGALLDGETLAAVGHWLRLMVVYDIVVCVAAYLTFEAILS